MKLQDIFNNRTETTHIAVRESSGIYGSLAHDTFEKLISESGFSNEDVNADDWVERE
jgi:hypothetical protein